MTAAHTDATQSASSSSNDLQQQLQQLKQRYTQHNQPHIFQHSDTLTPTEQQQLLHDAQLVDVTTVNSEFQRALQEEQQFKEYTSTHNIADDIKPFTDITDSTQQTAEQLQAWYTRGLQLLIEGKLAIILMSGGQGTRLKSNKPKGMFDIGLLSGKTLFQLQAEKIQTLIRLAGEQRQRQQQKSTPYKPISLPWFIMTSVATHTEIVQYFKQQQYFNLPQQDIIFFQQGELPAFSEADGSILMTSNHSISLSPNGNGGLFSSLARSKALDDLQRRHVKYVHVYGVDNVLIKVADPTFLGFVDASTADCANKVVLKNDPSERVGVMALKQGKAAVVEYSEIPKQLNELGDSKTGQLLYGAGNIAQHVFSVELLHKLASQPLPYHIARKAVPYYDPQQRQQVTPTQPNAIKLEMFIFDSFEYANKVVGYAVDRKSEFSPVKNASAAGVIDSPETAVKDITRYHTKLIERAGGKINVTSSDSRVEISPALSYDGEHLEQYVAQQTHSTPLHLMGQHGQ